MRRAWTVRDSSELYNVPSWGDGFFGINQAGRVEVKPRRGDGPAIDLLELTQDLKRRGLRTPLLVRFSDILASRVRGLCQAFRSAIDDYAYQGHYRGVYPIKVNQQRHVVEEIVQYGADQQVGLEAGSKPELLVALALLDTPDALIVCNGYKDRAYVELALLAQKLGRTPIVVIDRFHEIDLVIKTARELGIRPHVGIRARLSTKGAGKWIESTGERSKFGLSAIEIVNAVERLRAEDMLDCLDLLHFHIGSQITAIRAHKEALGEAGRIFVGLHRLGARPSILDVGGGHGQLTAPLVQAGHDVTVYGSSPTCAARLRPWTAEGRVRFASGDLLRSPFRDRAFDVVLSYRLLPHVPAWRQLVGELCRLAGRAVLVDYPTVRSVNAFSGATFGLKKRVEGNTRSFAVFRDADVESAQIASEFGKELFAYVVEAMRAARA